MRILATYILVLLSTSLFSQECNKQERIIIISDKVALNPSEPDIYKIKVIYESNGFLWELLTVNNYRDEFKFLCRMFDAEENEVIVFSNFSMPSGSTRNYFVDLKSKIVYKTKYLPEEFIPDIFSFNKNSLTIKSILLSPTNCGEISYHPLEKEEIQAKLKDLSGYEMLKTIKL